MIQTVKGGGIMVNGSIGVEQRENYGGHYFIQFIFPLCLNFTHRALLLL
jgi:hypothetical protein